MEWMRDIPHLQLRHSVVAGGNSANCGPPRHGCPNCWMHSIYQMHEFPGRSFLVRRAGRLFTEIQRQKQHLPAMPAVGANFSMPDGQPASNVPQHGRLVLNSGQISTFKMAPLCCRRIQFQFPAGKRMNPDAAMSDTDIRKESHAPNPPVLPGHCTHAAGPLQGGPAPD
jgi:hypothetical protein